MPGRRCSRCSRSSASRRRGRTGRSITFDTFTDGLKYLAVFFIVANVVDSEARLATHHPRARARLGAFPAFGAIWSHAHGEHLVEGDRAGWIGIFANPNDLAYHLVVGVAMVLAAANAATTRGRKLAWWALLVPIGLRASC